ncbi:MAG: hypothetical protein ACTSQI_03930 [Candidatus Helarchaeota archaeon]
MIENSDSCEELLTQLEAELNDAWELLKQKKAALKQGTIGVEEFKRFKQEIEGRIDDLSKRIYYINKAKSKIPDRDEWILQEAQLLMNEYQVEVKEDNISYIRIYLSISVHETWIIELNFTNPKVPLFKIPAELPILIGNPYETIESLKNWHAGPNQHLITIIREIEEKLLNLELKKSLPELELERGRVMDQAKRLEAQKAYEQAMTFYNYAADISDRIGNQAIAMVCRMKSKKLQEQLQKNQT